MARRVERRSGISRVGRILASWWTRDSPVHPREQACVPCCGVERSTILSWSPHFTPIQRRGHRTKSRGGAWLRGHPLSTTNSLFLAARQGYTESVPGAHAQGHRSPQARKIVESRVGLPTIRKRPIGGKMNGTMGPSSCGCACVCVPWCG